MSCPQVVLVNESGDEVLAVLSGGGVRYYSLPSMQLAVNINPSDYFVHNDKCFYIAGTARNFPATGWAWIQDSKHEPKNINVNDINVNATGDLVIKFSQPASKVGALVVGTDEGLASLNITAGASVGTLTSVIKFGNAQGQKIDASAVTGSGNIWVLGLMWK